MAKELEEAEIVSVRDVFLIGPLLTRIPNKAVTYRTKDLAPATIFIPEEEYADDVVRLRIQEDVKRRRAAKPTVVRI